MNMPCFRVARRASVRALTPQITPYFMPAVFSSGPIDKVSEWGNCLLSTAPGQGPDPSRLSSLHLTNKRGICGYSFKKGDICWNCRCGCRSI